MERIIPESEPTSRLLALTRVALRLIVIVAVAVAVAALIQWATRQSAALKSAHADHLMFGLFALLLLAYAVMIATPFVPGIEIGVTVLMIQGPGSVPAVYAATVLGLMLAYGLGRLLPYGALRGFCADLGLRRAAAMIARIEPLSPPERIALLQERLPRRLARHAVRYRYLLLALSINTPGNSLIGGGGGIMLVTGLSRLFSAPATFLTVLLAVAPFPLAVWLFDIDPMAGFYNR